ncbi:MAG TPA: hypothetical protein VMS35_07145 [Nitrososphaeraceae archaeon]|nr:hypothetical protein [Nitrososphaeraceae archaeon]HZL23632.1 hypothetical protein [Nitrososphaeraceae archaeon]
MNRIRSMDFSYSLYPWSPGETGTPCKPVAPTEPGKSCGPIAPV